MRLISGTCGSLADRVYESNTLEPLLISKLDLTNKVVKMCDERTHDEACSLWYIGTDGIDDCSCEVGIETVLRLWTVLVLWCSLSVWIHCEYVRSWLEKMGVW
jgi:hypothetical protein